MPSASLTPRDNRSLALLDAYRYLVSEKNLTLEEAFGFVCAKVDCRLGGPAGANVMAVVPDLEPYLLSDTGGKGGREKEKGEKKD